MTAKPSPTQADYIRYFAGLPASGQTRGATQATAEACRRNGWIEEIDQWPYHRATSAGLNAIQMTWADAVTLSTSDLLAIEARRSALAEREADSERH